MRATFIRTLVELAEEDERIVLLTGDLGFTVVEPFAERFPDRFFNVGVAEQNMLGVATGLAEAGFVPFAYSIATFATLRSYEFVRNGPVLHHLPVRIVGVGGGLEYGMNGLTHYALEDIAVMRTQPGMTVLAPADFQQARTALTETRAISGPIYFRLGKNETETVPDLGGRLRLDGVEQIGDGRDVAIVTTGSIAREAAAAVELLEAQGWRVAPRRHRMPEPVARPRRWPPRCETSRSPSRSRRTTCPVASARSSRRSSPSRASDVASSVAASPAFPTSSGPRRSSTTRTACRRRRSPEPPRRHSTSVTGPRTPSPPNEEAECDHRLLPGCSGGPGDVRAPDRDLPVDRGRLRDHLRQRRQPGQRARGAHRARRVGSAGGRRQPHAELRLPERVHERPTDRDR